MGYRLHYAEKFDVKLQGGAFKNCRDEFERLLDKEMEQSYCNIPENGEAYELVPEEVAAYIKKLASSDLDAVNEYFKTSVSWEMSNKDVLRYFAEMYAGYDKNNDFIYVEWF